MEALFADLGSRQRPDGVWADVHEKNEYQVYFTVRGLAASYANEKDEELLADKHIKSAHEFLLKKLRENSDGQLVNTKASINALAALQNLFGFHVHDLFPNLLISAVTRANKLGLLNSLLNPEANDSKILRAIRESARKQLEARGEDAVELLGVNSEIYRSVEKEPGLLKQFTGDRSSDENERREILEDLRRCLSATLTETRSKLSHRLIMRLWDSDGFLNFKPLIEHLSYLEQDRAFYKLYGIISTTSFYSSFLGLTSTTTARF